MKIPSTYSNNYNFSSSKLILYKKNLNEEMKNSHPVLKNQEVDYHSNFTYFFREDLGVNWENFIKITDEFFADKDNVNVYNFACSDGSETYSLALAMLSYFGEEKSKKFFPILAYDIDKKIIYEANSNRLNCNISDKYRIEKYAPIYTQYSTIIPKNRYSEEDFYFIPKKELKEKIKFSEGNFIQKINELDFSNSLIMCRNFWYYMGISKADEIIEKLSNKIDTSSLLIIGDFDRQYIAKKLEDHGFKEITFNTFAKQKSEFSNNSF